MSSDLDAKLDAIFNAKSKRIAEAKRVRLEAEQKQEENLQAFLELQSAVIRPTLQALADNLDGRDQHCSLYETTDGEKNGAETAAAGSGIRFYSSIMYKSIKRFKGPYLYFQLDKSKGKVISTFSIVAENRDGESVSVAVDFEAVTAEFINEEALKVIAAINR